MKKFIDINRLDHINPGFIEKSGKFLELRKIHDFFKSSAAAFIIENSIARHSRPGNPAICSVMRLNFHDLWEWHIAEELHQVIEKTIVAAPETAIPGDCLLMHKAAIQKCGPLYFCDIACFWPQPADAEKWLEIMAGTANSGEYSGQLQILIPPQPSDNHLAILQHLSRTPAPHRLLHCEFICDLAQ